MIIWYADINSVSDEMYKSVLSAFPANIARDIDRYHRLIDKKSRLVARLLIHKYYSDADLSFNWSDWALTEKKKPYMDGKPNFNISHSREKVLVGFSDQYEIGVDIEYKQAVDVSAFASYFHPEEIDFLESNEHSLEAFYKIWTRKEALLKAIGVGLLSGLNGVNVLLDEVNHDGNWQLKEIEVDRYYCACICAEKKTEDLLVQQIDRESLTQFILEELRL